MAIRDQYFICVGGLSTEGTIIFLLAIRTLLFIIQSPELVYPVTLTIQC